jgi:hypothetical protein
MSDKFRELVEQMARCVIPGDGDETMQDRVKEAHEEAGMYEADEEDPTMDDVDYVIAAAGDEFLCSETQAFWAMIREAREFLKNFISALNAANCIQVGK